MYADFSSLYPSWNKELLKRVGFLPSNWKPRNRCKTIGPREPCCGCSAGNISDLGDHHDVNIQTMCKRKPCCGCSAGNISHFWLARCLQVWMWACHWPYPVGMKTMLWSIWNHHHLYRAHCYHKDVTGGGWVLLITKVINSGEAFCAFTLLYFTLLYFKLT